MLIKSFAVIAVFSGTALPLSLLFVQSYLESQIPHCGIDMPSSARVCSDAVTGLKYDAQLVRSEWFKAVG